MDDSEKTLELMKALAEKFGWLKPCTDGWRVVTPFSDCQWDDYEMTFLDTLEAFAACVKRRMSIDGWDWEVVARQYFFEKGQVGTSGWPNHTFDPRIEGQEALAILTCAEEALSL